MLNLEVKYSVSRCLDDNEKSKVHRSHLGIQTNVKPIVIINESGLYSLILGIHKLEAKEFRK